MTTTTIKVDRAVRDRLKAQAAAEHRTLGDHLAHLADLAERRARLEQLREAMERTSDADLASYRAETSEWLDADLGAS